METQLTLTDLDVIVEHEYTKAQIGGSHDNSETENIPHFVTITSVKALPVKKELYVNTTEPVEIFPLLDEGTLQALELEILKDYQ